MTYRQHVWLLIAKGLFIVAMGLIIFMQVMSIRDTQKRTEQIRQYTEQMKSRYNTVYKENSMQLGGVIVRYDVFRHNGNQQTGKTEEGLVGHRLTLEVAEQLIRRRVDMGEGKEEEYHVLEVTTKRVK